MGTQYIVWFSDPESSEVRRLGGKNASLGEMTRTMRTEGIPIPEGFALTAEAYRKFLEVNNLRERISEIFEAAKHQKSPRTAKGDAIRRMIYRAKFPPEIEREIVTNYTKLCELCGIKDVDVAVRSSATAEDLPDASFAGQHDSFLNVRGASGVLDACKRCIASLFTDRAIVYRETHGFEHMKVALSVGIQRMVHSDRGAAGVMFSLDTETGFPRTVLINASWGLGEAVVQGEVEPDEYVVFKPVISDPSLVPIIEKNLGAKELKVVYGVRDKTTRTVATSTKERTAFVLSDEEILKLTRWAIAIEAHYKRPMDMEWAKDGETQELFIVQARPETVQTRREAGALKSYELKHAGEKLVEGLAVGDAIATGKVCRLASPAEAAKFTKGAILVTKITDPDWVTIMRRASAIVTDHGGRTSHAAIVSRELGLPAIVGAGNATAVLKDGEEVTVSCAEGDQGFVYKGIAEFDVEETRLESIPRTQTKVMLNMGNPAAAMRWWRLPADGVGLARIEFIISNLIKIHPMALVHFDSLKDKVAHRTIAGMTRGYADKTRYFVDMLAYGIARIAASRYPNPVIVRMSDFKTNEYAELIGGREFEPQESNPMIGWRGASRYYSEGYRDGFALECRAVRKVREEMGLTNVIVMIPFCRTLEEADQTLAVMAQNEVRRGDHGLEVYVMCEIPSNVILADDFADRFDGFSIGSNDLTQLTLGVDRDSDRLASIFNEQNPAVTSLIRRVIREAHRKSRKVGLCGQAPSDHPEFARFLVDAGIDSISVSPDSFMHVKTQVASAESERRVHAAAGGR